MRLAASIGLALILWAWVTTLRDPETTRSFSGVPLQVADLQDDLVALDPPDEVQVRATGPRSAIETMPSSSVSASLDMSKITEPGTYEIEIEVNAPESVWRTRSSPATVDIVVEAAITSSFPLDVDVHDLDASSLRTVNVEPDLDEVTVSGPSSLVDQVDRVVLTIETSGGSRTYQTTGPPVAFDAAGVAIEGVTVQPGVVAATVTVAARGKSVAVLVSTEGSPASGFEVVNRTANPVSVIVEGPEEVIDQMIAVSTESIDISGASSSVSATVSIVGLPTGVTVIQPQSGQVDVLVQIGQQGVRQSLTGLEIDISNLGPGLQGEVNPTELTIEVVAPEEVLSALTVESIQVIVDANGLGAGVHTVTPMVIVPAQVQWISANPIEVELTISAASTPAGA
jgi:YbbR domain-containing protein